MAEPTVISAPDIKAARMENPKMRDRDLADKLGISEAELVAAALGETATRIVADPGPDHARTYPVGRGHGPDPQ